MTEPGQVWPGGQHRLGPDRDGPRAAGRPGGPGPGGSRSAGRARHVHWTFRQLDRESDLGAGLDRSRGSARGSGRS